MSETKNSANILSILTTWESYFETYDEGIGTTYERFILHRYFERLKRDYAVNSVLEVPSFGMTGLSGINSMWWAGQGIIPVIADTNQERIDKSEYVWKEIDFPVQFRFLEDMRRLPFPDQSYDLSWNFASLWFVEDLTAFFQELKRVTKKALFICVPNHNGIGYILRKLSQREKIDGFYPEHIIPKKLKPVWEKLGLQLEETGYLDIPPWPDIAMKKEDLIKKVGLGFLLKRKTAADDTVFEKKCILDYFSGKKPNLEKEILKYDFLEKAPFPVNVLWGHHRYFILRILK